MIGSKKPIWLTGSKKPFTVARSTRDINEKYRNESQGWKTEVHSSISLSAPLECYDTHAQLLLPVLTSVNNHELKQSNIIMTKINFGKCW